MSQHEDVSYVEAQCGVKEMTTEWLLSEMNRLAESKQHDGMLSAIVDEIDSRREEEGHFNYETRELATLSLNEGWR